MSTRALLLHPYTKLAASEGGDSRPSPHSTERLYFRAKIEIKQKETEDTEGVSFESFDSSRQPKGDRWTLLAPLTE